MEDSDRIQQNILHYNFYTLKNHEKKLATFKDLTLQVALRKNGMNKVKNIGLSLVVISALGIGFSGCGGGSDSTTPAESTIQSNKLNIREINLSAETIKKVDSIKTIITNNKSSDEDTLIDTLSIKKEIETISGVVIEEQSSDSEREYLRYTVDGYGYIINETKSDSTWSSSSEILPTNPIRKVYKSTTNVTNKEALVLNPFSYALPNKLEYDVSTKLQNAGYNVTYIQDEAMTLDDLASVGEFDFVYIATHSSYQGILTTMIESTDDKWIEYEKNNKKTKLYKITTPYNGKTRWAVLPSFYTDLDIKFTKEPVFYLHMCQALTGNSQLDDVLSQKGAKAILGWDVSEEFSWSYSLDKDFLSAALKKDAILQKVIEDFRNDNFYYKLSANCDKEITNDDQLSCETRSFNILYDKTRNWKTLFYTSNNIILNKTDKEPTNSNENFTYSTITSPTTGKVWMDRNLGASQACTAYNDEACYGDYYQWGRGADGHEKSTSATTSSIATSTFPSHGDFITSSSSNDYDWTNSDSDGSTRESEWNVCPSGFRIPTTSELEAENIQDRDDAYSKLKLPSAGGRGGYSGSMDSQGSWGLVWSSSVSGSGSRDLGFGSDDAYSYSNYRADGFSVRCVRD